VAGCAAFALPSESRAQLLISIVATVTAGSISLCRFVLGS